MIQKILVVALMLGFVLVGVPDTASAQSTNDSTTSLAEQVANLLAEVQTLQARLAEIRGQAQDTRADLREARQLARDLAVGMTGEDVEELQEILASDPDIYPEGLVTGYFGSLTQRAVERFQDRFGIDSVGRVGPQTRRTINQMIQNRHTNLRQLRADRLGDLPDDVDTSGWVPGVTNMLLCHQGRTIAVAGPAVRAHLVHGDTLGDCDDSDERFRDLRNNDDTDDDDKVCDLPEALEDLDDSIDAFMDELDEIEDMASDDEWDAASDALEALSDDLGALESDLDDEGYTDAAEELNSLMSNLEEAVDDENEELVEEMVDDIEEVLHEVESDIEDQCDDNDIDEVEGQVDFVNVSAAKVTLTTQLIISLDDETVIDEDGDLDSLEAVENALDDDLIVRVEAEGELADPEDADEGLLYATVVKFEIDDDSDED